MSNVLQNALLGAFCNAFDVHLAIGIENHFCFLLRVTVLHRFYCNVFGGYTVSGIAFEHRQKHQRHISLKLLILNILNRANSDKGNTCLDRQKDRIA